MRRLEFIGPWSPEDQFNPDGPGTKAVDVVKRLLERQRDSEKWEWLDVERISDEFELCYRTDYSTVANEDVLFDAPIRDAFDPTKIGKEDVGNKTQDMPQSTLHFWYYKMSCMKEQNRIFLTIVIYTDRMTFDDVERTVEDWINTPETKVKWVNATKQRIKKEKKEKIVYDEKRETGKRCHSVKGGSMSGSKSHCEPYENYQKIPKKLQVWENLILTDVTPQKFEYEVNRWRKFAKKLFFRRSITLRQRQALKSWIRNAMLGNIMKNFAQFFYAPEPVEPIGGLFD
jgi:hypothetical protein